MSSGHHRRALAQGGGFESLSLHRRVRKEPPGSCELHPVLRGTGGSNLSSSCGESVGSPPTEKSERKRTDTRSVGPFPRGTYGSNPLPSSGQSVSLPELLSRVENPGF